MNMIQPILDFLLSFLKLSTNKILIGLLTIGLAASLTVQHINEEKYEKERLADKKERDSLRTAIVNLHVNYAAKENALYKEFYEKLAQQGNTKTKK